MLKFTYLFFAVFYYIDVTFYLSEILGNGFSIEKFPETSYSITSDRLFLFDITGLFSSVMATNLSLSIYMESPKVLISKCKYTLFFLNFSILTLQITFLPININISVSVNLKISYNSFCPFVR